MFLANFGVLGLNIISQFDNVRIYEEEDLYGYKCNWKLTKPAEKFE